MSGRSEARRLAVDLLYQADVMGRPPEEVLAERRSLGERIPSYTRELVLGVGEHREELDTLIGNHAEGWSIGRITPVDRTILRIACHEMLHRDDVPIAVAIDEAVETAKLLGQEGSRAFVNGILGRIAKDRIGT